MSKSEKSNKISEIYCKSLLSRKIYLNFKIFIYRPLQQSHSATKPKSIPYQSKKY